MQPRSCPRSWVDACAARRQRPGSARRSGRPRLTGCSEPSSSTKRGPTKPHRGRRRRASRSAPVPSHDHRIGIQEEQVFTAGARDSYIVRSSKAHVSWQRDELDILSRGQKRARVVRRGRINDDDLHVLDRRHRQERVKTRRDVAGAVVRDDDNGHSRHAKRPGLARRRRGSLGQNAPNRARL